MQDDKQAYRWLRQQNSNLSHCLKKHKDDVVAGSPQEALLKLKQHWQGVWNRPNINLEEAWQQAQEHLPQAPHQAVTWQSPSGQDCRGTVPGIDGWTAEEIGLFTNSMFDALAGFCDKCRHRGTLPKAWKLYRQVHLGKGKAPEPDGATLTANLRPVSIASVFWRTYTKACFKKTETQTWLRETMPDFVYGGIPKRGVQDGVGRLLKCVHDSWFVGTLDLSLAFDMASPHLAVKAMKCLGMCHQLANMLLDAWQDQTRYLQFLGETDPMGVKVDRSLPQGDSFSMCAMTCLILPAALAIREQFPQAVQVIFADDRSFATPSASQLAQVSKTWQVWTKKLGLQENMGKAQYSHFTIKGRRQLVGAGLQPDRIKDNIRILGFSFTPARGRKADENEKQRLKDSQAKASKCACLPGGVKRRVRLAQYSVLPKARWGWLFRRPALSDIRQLEGCARRLLKKQKQASPFLFSLVRGHAWDLRFTAVCEAVAIVHRMLNRARVELEDFPRARSGWVGAMRKGLRDLGWVEMGRSWKWHHQPLGFFLTLRHGQQGWQDDLKLVQHQLRETWRWTCYSKWQRQSRLDSQLCSGISYHPARVKTCHRMKSPSRRELQSPLHGSGSWCREPSVAARTVARLMLRGSM